MVFFRTVFLLLCLMIQPILAQEDAYEKYVKTSKDFVRVKQDRDFALNAWPGWVYMPWTWKWHIGYTEASAQWSIAHGYNGAFLDHGWTQVGGIDKLVLPLGKEAIDRELYYKISPLLEQGRYIPTIDHTVPPDVSYANWLYYLELTKRLLEGHYA